MIRNWLAHLHFRDKIMGIIFFVMIMFSTVAIWQIRQDVSVTLGQALDRQGLSIANDIAARSGDYIYTNNIFGFYLFIKDIMEYSPDVRYIFLQDSNGNVVVSSFGRGVPADLLSVPVSSEEGNRKPFVLATEEGLIHDISVPVNSQTGEGGYVRVGMTEEGMQATLSHLTGRMLWILFIATLLGMLVAYILTNLLNRPILTLVQAVKEVGAGDLDQRVSSPNTFDEIGELSRSFNQMMDNLQDYNVKVRDFSRELVVRNDQLQDMSNELVKKEERLRYFLDKIITAQEEERRRIARELHDQTSQSLTSLLVGLRTVESASGLEDARQKASALRLLTTGVLEEVHDLALELRPSVLDDLGLPAALQRYCKDNAARYGFEIDIHIDGFKIDERISSQIETALYRIIQEAITNIAKHAEASNVSIVLRKEPKRILAIVEDDGLGFNVETTLASPLAEKKLGLYGMQERIALLDGTMTIESISGEGTTLYFEVPLHDKEGENG